MTRKEKWESWAKQWEDKVPNLAKALRNEELQKTCSEMEEMAWHVRIQERSLIIYVIESALADEDFPEDYKMALRDEIQNHNIAISEYKEELKKLQ